MRLPRAAPKRPALVALLLVALLVLAAAWATPMLVERAARHRIHQAASARGWTASWEGFRAELPARLRLERFGLLLESTRDTVLWAEALTLALDPWSLLTLRPRVAEVHLAHAGFRIPGDAGADLDTLPPEPRPQDGLRTDPERAAEVRRSAESLVRLLAAPARQLPRLSLRDVTIENRRDADGLWAAVRLAWLDLSPDRGGARLAASGALLGERDVPFEAALVHGTDDRLQGGVRLAIPEPDGKLSPVRVTVDGAVSQDRRAGVVTVSDSTRVRVGELEFKVGASLTRQGPRARMRLEAENLTEERLKRSLPDAILGPLRHLGVRGSWGYRLELDLDLSRPDSVTLRADVDPRGLALDPSRTRLNLLDLDEPFVATIRLPGSHVATRDLSVSNPHFRPLGTLAPELVYAVMTNEDGGFFRHRGFSTEAVRSAIAENVKAGAFRRGAGTITMQIARNLYVGHERTLSRKFREVVLAWVLEHLTGLSKERLLEIYLNVIEWGPGVHGASEATRFYFDRDPAEIGVDEALFLATVVPAPRRWRTRFDPQGALRPFARAQMHFIGRAMVAKDRLSKERLPVADSLRIELAGPARQALFPGPIDGAPAVDSVPGPGVRDPASAEERGPIEEAGPGRGSGPVDPGHPGS